ncbi:unnamed protein product, partial [Symbiodinium sp. KB8]
QHLELTKLRSEAFRVVQRVQESSQQGVHGALGSLTEAMMTTVVLLMMRLVAVVVVVVLLLLLLLLLLAVSEGLRVDLMLLQSRSLTKTSSLVAENTKRSLGVALQEETCQAFYGSEQCNSQSLLSERRNRRGIHQLVVDGDRIHVTPAIRKIAWKVKRASVDRCSPRLATLMNSVREVVATADRMSNAPSLKTAVIFDRAGQPAFHQPRYGVPCLNLQRSSGLHMELPLTAGIWLAVHLAANPGRQKPHPVCGAATPAAAASVLMMAASGEKSCEWNLSFEKRRERFEGFGLVAAKRPSTTDLEAPASLRRRMQPPAAFSSRSKQTGKESSAEAEGSLGQFSGLQSAPAEGFQELRVCAEILVWGGVGHGPARLGSQESAMAIICDGTALACTAAALPRRLAMDRQAAGGPALFFFREKPRCSDGFENWAIGQKTEAVAATWKLADSLPEPPSTPEDTPVPSCSVVK